MFTKQEREILEDSEPFIHRRWCERARMGFVSSATYDRSLKQVNLLVLHARQAVPNIQDEDIEVRFSGDRHNKGQMLIEFKCPRCPKGWEQIEKVPLVLA